MKRFLSLLIALMAFQLSATAQIKIEVTLPDSLVGKGYVQNYVKQAMKDLSVKPTDPVVVPPVVRPDCPRGPVIDKVVSNTNSSVQIRFDAFKVDRIEYEIIRDGGALVKRDTTANLTTNVVILNFPAQSNGTFNLIIRGRSCVSKSDSKVQFSIKSDQGDGGPVIPPTVPDNSNTYSLKTVVTGFDDHLKLIVRDSADVRLISDVGVEGKGDNYNYRYLVGAEILTQKNKLTNYIVAGNNPLRVLKMKLRSDLETINHWGTGQEEYGWYYQRDAGESFSNNTSFAFNTMVFTGRQSDTGFLNHIPQSYEPSNQVPSWADIAPDMQLPAGHVWIADWQGWTPERVYQKGVTHLPHHQLPWNEADGNKYVISLKNAGKTYNNVPRIEHILRLVKSPPVIGRDGKPLPDDYSNGWNKSWWPNGPLDPQAARTKADEVDISDAIWIGETMENEAWMFADVDMWRHFYARLRERYEERFGKRGIPYQIVHNYFFLWPREISLSRDNPADYYRKLLVTKPEDLPKTPYSPGGVLSKTTMITDAIYLGAPDIQTGVIYESIFRFEINKILGYDSGVFLAAVHEYRPNNKYQFRYPEGKFYTDKKVPLDPNVHIAAGFVAQVYGKLFVEWGAPLKKDHKNHSFEWAKGWWYPTGATSPQDGFPYYSYTNDYYAGFDGGSDLSYFSQRLFNETFGQTDGGQRRYLTHRIDGGKWIRPDQANAQEIVSAYEEKRGFAYAQTKNGKTAWFYLNSYADNKWHVLDVELPNGQIVSYKVAGNGIHAKIQ